MDKEKFGAYLSKLRKKNGLTQAELAKKINVTDKAISKWERGIGLPDINSIEPLADALGVSIVDIMKSDDTQIETSDEKAEEAVKNTISLAKLQKKRLRMKIISLFMVYIALKAVYGIFFDTSASSYNNLPMILVYVLLAIYILITGIVVFKAFIKGFALPNR